ncbi:MAG: hypothetical protein H7145_15835 [Akkermansiaceae bacterium]|nr:hypothetical protein [Armatimonadota bacterium]
MERAAAFSRRFAAPFVWVVYAAMLCLMFRFVAVYGVNMPHGDEFEDTVPRIAGAVPVTLEWLWSPWNEHRILLPRLISLAVLGITGTDFKAMMFFNAGLLGAGCALLLLAAGRVRARLSAAKRGYRWSAADAFFPLVLLHTGHWDNLTSAFQIQFFSATFLIALLVFAALTGRVTKAEQISASYFTPLAVLFGLLALSGGSGLVFALPGSVALVVLGVVLLRQGGSKRAGWLAIGTGLLIGTVIALYFRGLHPESPGGLPVTVRTITHTALNYTAMGLGRGMMPVWDTHRTVRIVGMFLAVGGAVAAALLLARSGKEKRHGKFMAAAIVLIMGLLGVGIARVTPPGPYDAFMIMLIPAFTVLVTVSGLQTLADRTVSAETRIRLLWMGVLIAGALLAAVAVGKGRAPMGSGAGFAPRYCLLSAQLLVGVYFAALLQHKSDFVRRFVPIVLFALSAVLLPANRYDAKLLNDSKRRMLADYRDHARKGFSLEILTALGTPRMHPRANQVRSGIVVLRAHGFAPFARTPDAPGVRAVPVQDGTPRTTFPEISMTTPTRIPVAGAVGPVRAVVVGYADYAGHGLFANYEVVALRRIPGGYVEQGESRQIPNPDFGTVLLEPGGEIDAIEVRPVRDPAGGGPARIRVNQITLLQEYRP